MTSGTRSDQIEQVDNGNRFTWRTTLSQIRQIEKRRFTDEHFQAAVNRLLRKLSDLIEAEQAPEFVFTPSLEQKLTGKSFRAEAEVKALIERQQEETTQAKIDKLLAWAMEVPATLEIKSQEEALGILKRMGRKEIKTMEALEELTWVCSDKFARNALWELHSNGKIKLVAIGNTGIRLPTIKSKHKYVLLRFVD
jgi:hypothetical protein